jgi:hypothetical protein
MNGNYNDTFYVKTLNHPLGDCAVFKANEFRILIDKNIIKDSVLKLLSKKNTNKRAKKILKYIKKKYESNFSEETNLFDSVYVSRKEGFAKVKYYLGGLISFHLEKGDCQIFYNQTPIYTLKVYGFIESPGYYTMVGSIFETEDNKIIYKNIKYFSIDETVRYKSK